MKLYELSEAYRRIELEGDDYAIALNSIADEFDVKVENIAKLIREAEAEESTFKEEARRMSEKAGYAANRVARLKDYVRQNMEAIGRDKVQGKLFSVSVQDSTPSVVISDDASIPQEFLRHVPEEWQPDKKALLDYWKANGTIPDRVKGVEIHEGKHIRIR